MGDEADRITQDELDDIAHAIVMASPSRPRRKGGFAVLDPTKHRELSSKGGKSAHAKGVAHQFTPEEAKVAGRLGGLAANETKRYKASQHDETKEDWNSGAT